MSQDAKKMEDSEGLGFDEATDTESWARMQATRERHVQELRARGIRVETQQEHRRKVLEREARRATQGGGVAMPRGRGRS